MSRSPVQPYITDPPSAASTRRPGRIPGGLFDVKRTMLAIAAGLLDGIPPLPHPNDDLLVATLVAHGQPRFAAEEVRGNPAIRLRACMFWSDVQNAARGDREAKERVDVIRQAWQQMRQIELISDRPGHTIGLWER